MRQKLTNFFLIGPKLENIVIEEDFPESNLSLAKARKDEDDIF